MTSVRTLSVGIIANPSSGRDIRRLLGLASVFPTAEKINVVLRLLGAMGRLGVIDAWMIPDRAGIARRVRDDATLADKRGLPMPTVHLLDMRITDGPADSATATGLMRAQGVELIAVLGGDGTHRIVATHCGNVPLATLSTGTNNAFPDRREATVVGMAAALVAAGRVPPGISLRANKCLRVKGPGVDELALVDIAVSRARHVGARAIADASTLSDLYVSFADAQALGLSSIAGLLRPVSRTAPYGLHISFGPGQRLWAPILPGTLLPVSVAAVRRLAPSKPLSLTLDAGTVALDGEREIEIDAQSELTIELGLDGPKTIDVEAVLVYAAMHRLLIDCPGEMDHRA